MAASGKGGAVWLVLAGALAVPGVFAYQWWAGLKAEQDKGLSAKARSRLPEGVFQTAPAAGRLVNPISASTAAPSVPAPVAVVAVSAPAPPAPALMPAPSLALPARPAPATAAVESSSAPAAAALPRDPMLSPMDLMRMREEELARERARRLIEEAARQPKGGARRPAARKEPPIDGKVDLQGIVAKPDGDNLAIVNNATVTPGETFKVPGYSSKVRVVKISSVGVTFEYKGRRFTKNVSQE